MAVVFESPVSHRYGSRPADEVAEQIRAAGGTADVKVDPVTDNFRVHVPDEK